MKFRPLHDRVVVKRVTAEEQPVPRIPYPPEEIRDRFRSCFGSVSR